jgi:hypothetical protein
MVRTIRQRQLDRADATNIGDHLALLFSLVDRDEAQSIGAQNVWGVGFAVEHEREARWCRFAGLGIRHVQPQSRLGNGSRRRGDLIRRQVCREVLMG